MQSRGDQLTLIKPLVSAQGIQAKITVDLVD
jgi:hypothetical protein